MLKQLRIKIGGAVVLLGLLIMNPACSTVKLPDPTVEYAKPPASLMEPSKDMKTIPNGE